MWEDKAERGDGGGNHQDCLYIVISTVHCHILAETMIENCKLIVNIKCVLAKKLSRLLYDHCWKSLTSHLIKQRPFCWAATLIPLDNAFCRLEQLKLERGDSLKNLRTTALLNLGNISVTGLYKYQVRFIKRSLCFDGILSTDIFCTKLLKVTNNLRLRFFDIFYELIGVGN